MLSINEKHILDKIFIVYESNINNRVIYNINDLSNLENLEFNESSFNNKMLKCFFGSLTKYELKYIIYKVSYMAYRTCNLNKIKNIDLENIDNNSTEILLMIVNLLLKYFILSSKAVIAFEGINDFNKKEIDWIKKIDFNEINLLSTAYRKILTNIYSRHKNYIEVLEDILNNEKYDEFIIKTSNGLINDINDLNNFKKHIERLIILDTFLLIKYENYGDFEVMNYINTCFKSNHFTLPNNNVLLKKTFINYFLSYNINYIDKEYIIKRVEENNKKELKLINPLYKLDTY